MHVCIYTCMYVYMHFHTQCCICTYSLIHPCMYTYIHACNDFRTHADIHSCTPYNLCIHTCRLGSDGLLKQPTILNKHSVFLNKHSVFLLQLVHLDLVAQDNHLLLRVGELLCLRINLSFCILDLSTILALLGVGARESEEREERGERGEKERGERER